MPALPPVVAWLLGVLAQGVPSLLGRLVERWSARRGARDEVEAELLVRLLDPTEGTFADVYEVARVGNVPASEVAAAVLRLADRGLLERHPDMGWVLSDRGRAVAQREVRRRTASDPGGNAHRAADEDA